MWLLLVGVILSITILIAYNIVHKLPFVASPVSVCDNILLDIPCAAPCWQGLTPGEAANSQKIVKFVSSFPNARYVDTRNFYNPHQTHVMWSWNTSPSTNLIIIEDEKIVGIEIYTNCFLPIEDILRKYQTPAACFAREAGYHEKYIEVQLYYPELGLTFILNLVPDTPTITATTPIVAIRFSRSESTDEFEMRDTRRLYQWFGYGEIPQQMIVNSP